MKRVHARLVTHRTVDARPGNRKQRNKTTSARSRYVQHPAGKDARSCGLSHEPYGGIKWIPQPAGWSPEHLPVRKRSSGGGPATFGNSPSSTVALGLSTGPGERSRNHSLYPLRNNSPRISAFHYVTCKPSREHAGNHAASNCGGASGKRGGHPSI